MTSMNEMSLSSFEQEGDPNSLIMTFGEYAEKHRDGVYEYAYDGIEVYGTLHRTDPSDAIFADITSRVQESDADVVLVEGMRSINNISPEERAESVEYCAQNPQWQEELIQRSGESNYVAMLAILAGKEVFSPEPRRDDELWELEKFHERDDILTYYVFRRIAQYGRLQGEKPDFDTYISETIEEVKSLTQWEDFDYSLETVRAVQRELYDVDDFDVESDFYADAIDPVPWPDKVDEQTVINRVGSTLSHFRDQHIFEEIQRLRSEEKSILMIYGATHVQKLEPAIAALYGS